ncbi:MAG: tetratricopeptide repeat protein [bacterium]|nr:tetratricopeptide repeat protein [bacterium]
MGLNAKRTVMERFLLPGHVHKWFALYKSLIDVKGKKLKRKKIDSDLICKEFIKDIVMLKKDVFSFWRNNEFMNKSIKYYRSVLKSTENISDITLRVLSRVYIHYKMGLLYHCHGSAAKRNEHFRKADNLYNEIQLEKILETNNLLKIQVGNIHYTLGSTYERAGLLDKAKEIFETTIRLFGKEVHPERTDLIGGANFHLGYIYQRMGESEKAREYFEECLRFIPNHEEAWRNLSSIYLKQGKFKEVEKKFNEVLSSCKDKEIKCDILFQIGVFYSEQQRYKEAEKTQRGFILKAII